MNKKPKWINLLLELINFPVVCSVVCLWGFFAVASFIIFLLSLSNTSFLILLIPMSFIIFLTLQYIRSDSPVESLNRLILIDGIIFLLYLTFFFVFMLVLIDPLDFTNFMVNYAVLSILYRFYQLLLIPLVGFTFVTIFYLKINIPVRRKTLSIILTSTITIIVLYIVIYFLLNWSIPILDNLYKGFANYD